MKRLWKMSPLAIFIGYQFLVHLAFQGNQNKGVRLFALSLPLLGLAFWVFSRAKNKLRWSFVLLLGGLEIYLVEQDQIALLALYGISHFAAYVALLYFFGRTLMPGGEALITRLARRIHGTLPLEMEAYTRKLTIAWCLFFSAQLIMSVLLYRFTSLESWVFFINLLNLPLLALMFIADYVYRLIRFRHYPQPTIMKAIEVFMQDSLSESTNVR